MKKIFFAASIVQFCLIQNVKAQQGKYIYFCESKDANISVNVKGDPQGRFSGADYYYEKVDALNHKIKEARVEDGEFKGMKTFLLDETLLSVSNLKVAEKKYDNKTFYIVNVRPNNSKKPIKVKHYSTVIGGNDDTYNGSEFDLDVPFATKAKAEAFIADLRNDIK